MVGIDENELKLVSIVCLTIIVVAGLFFDFDRFLLSMLVAAIAGLAGYEIGVYKRTEARMNGRETFPMVEIRFIGE